MLKIIAIDVGLANLGLAIASVHPDYQLDQFTHTTHIDLTQLQHKRVKFEDCKLHHTRDATDRVNHFIQEYHDVLSGANHVIIERQPLGGLVHVEQLLYSHFRDIAWLCSPNAMHKHFQLPVNDYEGRKRATTSIAHPYLVLSECVGPSHRLHDVADAVCMVLYFVHIKHIEFEKVRLKYELDNNLAFHGHNMSTFFESFRHRSKPS